MESRDEERESFLATLCENYNRHSGIFKIFNKCQTSSACHMKCMKELIRYQQLDLDKFTLNYLRCVSKIFAVTTKSDVIDLSFDFAVKYCGYQYTQLPTETSDLFLASIFRFIYLFNDSDNNQTRRKCCIFVNRVLACLGNECLLNEEVILMISSSMRRRLKDIIPVIRSEAATALERLQDPQDEQCKVTRDLMFHLEHDPSPLVRENIVKSLAISNRTLLAVFGRVNDIDTNVKKATFTRLTKLKVYHLSIKQRQTILTAIILDNDKSINSMIHLYVKAWFSNCNEDYIKLVAVLDPETIPKNTLKTALFILFNMKASTDLLELMVKLIDDQNLIPLDQLTMEMASFWYHVILYFQNPPENVVMDEDAIYKILPDLTPFTSHIAKFFNILKENGTPENLEAMMILLNMISFFCLSDEMGRRETIKLCKDLLLDPHLDLRLIPFIVDKLPKLIECPEVRTRTIAEWISVIRIPLTDENGLEGSIEPTRDQEIIIKCLTILKSFLRSSDITKIDATLQTILERIIQPAFSVNSSKILSLAQYTLGQLCLLDLKLAKVHFINYCIQLADDDEPLLLSTITAILDMLAVHGFNFVNPYIGGFIAKKTHGITCLYKDKSFNNHTIKTVVQTIMDLVEHKDPEISSTAVGGLARLYFTSNLKSPYIFGYFTLVWFCPLRYNAKIRSTLLAFFSTFVEVNCDADIIIKSVIPTLNAIKTCKEDDPWCDVNKERVTMFLVHLLSKECWTEKVLTDIDEKGSYHFRLAQTLCKQVSRSSLLAEEIAEFIQLLELDADDGKFVDEMLSDLKGAIININRQVDQKVINIYRNFQVEVEELKTNYNIAIKKQADKNLITSAKKARLSKIIEEQKGKETVSFESFLKPQMETDPSPISPQGSEQEEDTEDSEDESGEKEELNSKKWNKYRNEGSDDSESE